jgi:hypothetical protein
VLFLDGSDHNECDHPLLFGDRLDRLDRAMKRGAGLVALHYTLFVPKRPGGPQFLEWLGGYFDYQSGPAPTAGTRRSRRRQRCQPRPCQNTPLRRAAALSLREEYY